MLNIEYREMQKYKIILDSRLHGNDNTKNRADPFWRSKSSLGFKDSGLRRNDIRYYIPIYNKMTH